MRGTDCAETHLLTFLREDRFLWPKIDATFSEQLTRLLIRHGLLGIYDHKLRISADWKNLPAFFTEKLEHNRAALWTVNMQLAAMQDYAVQCLTSEGIPCIVLKGLPLSERLYGHALLRSLGDVDLLVKPEESEKALACLKRAGFSDAQGEVSFHIPLYCEKFRGTLELHGQLSDERVDFPIADIFSRTHTETLSDAEHRVMDPSDELLYLSYHAAVSYLVFRLYWLTDIKAFLNRFSDKIDWQAVTNRSRNWRLRKYLFATFYVLSVVFPDSLTKEIDEICHKNPQPFLRRFIELAARPKKPFSAPLGQFALLRKALGYALIERN